MVEIIKYFVYMVGSVFILVMSEANVFGLLYGAFVGFALANFENKIHRLERTN